MCRLVAVYFLKMLRFLDRPTSRKRWLLIINFEKNGEANARRSRVLVPFFKIVARSISRCIRVGFVCLIRTRRKGAVTAYASLREATATAPCISEDHQFSVCFINQALCGLFTTGRNKIGQL